MTTYYFWDEIEDNVVREYDENNNTLASYTTEPTRFGSVLAQDRSGERRYFQFDGLGNTTELTDASGLVTDTRRFTAFGADSSRSGATAVTFEYQGAVEYSTVPGTTSVYARARLLPPALGRWHSKDPLGMADSPNAYAFMRNAPTAHIDPSGLLSQETTAIPIPFLSLALPGQAYGDCGSYIWATRWILGPTERNGIIFQIVEVNNYIRNCDPRRKDPCSHPEVRPASCANAKPLDECRSGGSTSLRYIELWRVRDGVVQGGATGPHDVFAWLGCIPPCSKRNCTFGRIFQTGKAFFVDDDAWKPLQTELQKEFKQGAEGIANACNLASACAKGKALALFNQLGATITTPWTFKIAIRQWNCCQRCETGYAYFAAYSFQPSGELVE